MSAPLIKSIAIVGGGTAGWMTAAALARALDTKDVSITLVESEQIGTVGVGEATIPNIVQFNRMLGIDERDFMSATQATFKLGIKFEDWGAKGESYFHPFGWHGFDMDGVPFHQYWRRYKDMGGPRIEEFCISAVAAQQDKFSLPETNPRSALSRIGYAYQFDASLYAAYLRRYSEERGVIRQEGKVTTVKQQSETGHISGVTLESGRQIDAEFFIDCTGFRSLLIGKTLGEPYTNWSHWLPCNSAVAASCSHTKPVPPYTRAFALSAGWQWQVPLQHRTGNGYVYSNDFISDTQAADDFANNLESKPLSAAKQLRFVTGKRQNLWVKNCVSIGLSGGFLEPLESTSIYLIQAGITKLLALFPDSGFSAVEREEYNRIISLEYEQIRDFLILHYKATQRQGEPFWDYVRTMKVPDTLTRKTELFKERGGFFRYDGDLFDITSWVAVLLGQNIIPSGHAPIIDSIPAEDLKTSLESMRAGIANAVGKLPTHEQFLSQYCPANPL